MASLFTLPRIPSWIGHWALTLNGVTKTLVEWGLEDVTLKTGSLLVGELTCRRILARADDPPLLAFDEPVILRSNRGTIRFRGRREHTIGNMSGRSESQFYRFVDAWDELIDRKYEQAWTTIIRVGSTDPDPGFEESKTVSYNPHLILLNGKTVAEELTNIIEYAASQGVPIAVGTIHEGNVYPPTDEVICRDCASLITQLMAWLPGYTSWLDYTEDPPTFNCVPASALTAVTVPAFGAGGSEDLTIEALRKDVASAVVIRYERVDRTTVDGETRERPVVTHDVYPPGSTGRERRAISELVTLEGRNVTTITAPLTVGSFPGNNTAADFESILALSFWQQKIFNTILSDPTIDGLSIAFVAGSFTRQAARSADEDDPDAVVEMPRYLIAGQIAPWMRDDEDAQILWQKQKLTIKVDYDKYADATAADQGDTSKIIEQVRDQPISIYVTATTAPEGYNLYSLDTAIEEAEQPLSGLARHIYDQMSVLHWRGTRRNIKPECDGEIKMGHKLNLTGGAGPEGALWATMAEPVQAVTEHIDTGTTEATFGPASKDSIGLRIALARAHRLRRRWTASTVQTTGEL